ncbi:unnamed protein product [Cuscuta europaea]|uniref:Retrovirus-related Pol polyprotein from transposon TNT 1-94-like beta-barrel domain-containing protein n=1 Tax=Cuscuta europaea TaxID=41803 RepID=A0A9P0ZGV4_CUSEU|nr:unnamed protein product [Cuscuta europaea]
MSFMRADGGNNTGFSRRNRPKCDFCHNIGHTKDRCWKLYGRPPPSAHVAQLPPSPIVLSPEEYAAYQQFKLTNMPLSTLGLSTAYVSHTIGSWIIDSGASDHIYGNPHLLSHISKHQNLPLITLANGLQTSASGIGQALPLSSFPVDSVLYVPNTPFNLLSVSKITRALNCSVTFSADSVIVQDHCTGKRLASDMNLKLIPHHVWTSPHISDPSIWRLPFTPSDGHKNCSPLVDRSYKYTIDGLGFLPLCLLWPRRLIPLRRIPYVHHQLPQHPKILRIICPLPSEKVRVLL